VSLSLSLYDHLTSDGTEGWSGTSLGCQHLSYSHLFRSYKTRKEEALLLAQAEADNPNIVSANGDTELSEESMSGALHVSLLWKRDDQQCGMRSSKAMNGQPQTKITRSELLNMAGVSELS